MEVESSQYADGMRQAEKRLLDFLRTMEAHLEGLHLNRLAEQNARLKERLGETLEALRADLALSSPPEQLQEFHTKFSKAVQHCADAYAFLLHFISQEFAMDFLKGRYEFCRGKYLLYELRAGLPILQQYWVFPDVLAALPALEIQEPDLDVPVGIIRKERQEQRSAYSLYVPEHYTPYKEWPLIVCLHSGYSREDDYLLTWLRAAKSKGYMLLAPKSGKPGRLFVYLESLQSPFWTAVPSARCWRRFGIAMRWIVGACISPGSLTVGFLPMFWGWRMRIFLPVLPRWPGGEPILDRRPSSSAGPDAGGGDKAGIT